MREVLQKVVRQVKPRKAERERLREVASKLVERTNEACSELEVPARAMLVGSAARGTWLRDDRDIDIFILFPEHLLRGELERKGLEVARRVAGKRGKEQFAEHPYITTRIGGFDVDLVPCYDVADPSKIRSAVDRSPHHQNYVEAKLTPRLADEILLLKQFMRGIGTYGAELKIQGFSGYLSELLVLNYGSFRGVVETASGWEPGVVLDLRREYPDPDEARALFEGQPLIIIDPVDPNRNAAAVVSMQNFATFVRACQDFLREPDERFFFPKPVRSLSLRDMRERLVERGTTLFCVAFESPDLVHDVLYPQLKKTERTLAAGLERAGFKVLRSDVWSDGKSLILLELAIAKLPKVRTHVGPPVTIEAEDFVRKHLKSRRRFTGPFVDTKGRLTFEIGRKHTRAKQILESTLKEGTAFGKHVAESLSEGYSIYEGKQVTKLCRVGKIRRFLSEYLKRCLPWLR
ncbi:MAG: CCA tRNA nucleotidyltransferase [Candidatus Hadarchaeota archaeon]|nr:CCA tRNA nucleotidyltransferase [Candidatus Hadarchaeota archaeon]